MIKFSRALCVSALFMMPGLAYGSATLTLSPCHVEGLAEQVECGFLTVPENYEQPEGRTIDLHVVRLPAKQREKGTWIRYFFL